MHANLLRKTTLSFLAFIFAPLSLVADIFTDEEIAMSVSIKELDAPLKPVKQVQPEISSDLVGLQASIQIGFIIDEKGKVMNTRIVRSSNDALNQVAMDCVAQWQFEAGKKGGSPVAVRVVVPMRFK
jgi:TonB family protein